MRSTKVPRLRVFITTAMACLAAVGRGEPIDHAVMIRGPFDEAHRQIALRGPVALVAVGDEAACYTAYAAAAGDDDEPERSMEVGAGDALRLGPPAFLLMPATRLGDGTPADAARAVYEARPILDPPAAAARVVDDFGLNRLVPGGGSRAAAWVTVRPADRR